MTKQKVIPLIIFTFLTLTLLSQTIKNCTSNNLYGKWIFIKYYQGKLLDIKPLLKKPLKLKFGTPVMAYNKTGIYIDNQGDYKTEGKFKFDNTKCLIKTFDNNGTKGDTTLFEIMYLDKKYLLITKHGTIPYSYFYRRK